MSIWSELLFLHGHLTRVPEQVHPPAEPSSPAPEEAAARLREVIGCPSPRDARRPEPRGPLLGVKGLA